MGQIEACHFQMLVPVLGTAEYESDQKWRAALPGKRVYLLATFWGSRCDLECAGALQGKARRSCVIQDEGYRGASALALSLVRPGNGP